MSMKQSWQQGGVVGAKPHYTGGQARIDPPIEKKFSGGIGRVMTVRQGDVEYYQLPTSGWMEVAASIPEFRRQIQSHTLAGMLEHIRRDYYGAARRSVLSSLASSMSVEEQNSSGLNQMLTLGIDPVVYGYDFNSGTHSKLVENPAMELAQVYEPQRISAAQIHAELYEQADALLVDQGPFVLEKPMASDRVNTLKAMGFSRQGEVAEFEKQTAEFDFAKQAHSQQAADRLLGNRYRLMFPNYKFISTSVIIKLMGKYGLEMRGTEDFIGKIPDANVADMARFREALLKSPSRKEVSDGYVIVATPDQFIERRRYMGGTMSEAEFKQWLIDDPIVLAQVKGGALVITAWGDEAADPDVINERNN